MLATMLNSILVLLLILVSISAIIFISVTIAKVVNKYKRMIDEQRTQQVQVNESLYDHITSLQNTTDAILKFVEYGTEHIKAAKEESQKLRQFFMESRAGLDHLTKLYEAQTKRIDNIEDNIKEIDKKVEKAIKKNNLL